MNSAPAPALPTLVMLVRSCGHNDLDPNSLVGTWRTISPNDAQRLCEACLLEVGMLVWCHCDDRRPTRKWGWCSIAGEAPKPSSAAQQAEGAQGRDGRGGASGVSEKPESWRLVIHRNGIAHAEVMRGRCAAYRKSDRKQVFLARHHFDVTKAVTEQSCARYNLVCEKVKLAL